MHVVIEPPPYKEKFYHLKKKKSLVLPCNQHLAVPPPAMYFLVYMVFP